MGMTLKTLWVCDRCKKEVYEILATLPAGWKAYAELELFVNADNLLADVKLPTRERTWYHCDECVRDFLYGHMKFEEPEFYCEICQSETHDTIAHDSGSVSVDEPEDDGEAYEEVRRRDLELMEAASVLPVVGEDEGDGVDGS